jgi:hypothetical protein
MKKITFLLFITITINSFAQEVFTSAFVGEIPTAIQVVDNYLYVGTIQTSKLYRLTIDEPTNIELVAEFTDPLWKMVFDSMNNDFYCSIVGSFSRVDLDLSIPITPETIIPNIYPKDGLEETNNIIYMSDESDIYSYDIAIGPSSHQIFYSDAEGIIMNPRVYNNELYYQLYNPFGPPNNGVYKIDITNPSAQRVLVASDLGGIVQSSLIVDNYLYLGTETSNKLLRLDLSTPNLPLTPVVLLDNLGAAILGLARKNSSIYYTSGFQTIHTYQDSVLNSNDLVQKPFSIYPNPTSGQINVNGVFLGNTSYSIYSLTGFKIKDDELRSTINISDLAGGIYFLKLNQNGYVQTEKIIKTH